MLLEIRNIVSASLFLWLTAILVVTVVPGIIFGPLLFLVAMVAFQCSWPALPVLLAALIALRFMRLRLEWNWLLLSLSGLAGLKLSLVQFESMQDFGSLEGWTIFPLLAFASALIRHQRRLQRLFYSWHTKAGYDFLSDKWKMLPPHNQSA